MIKEIEKLLCEDFNKYAITVSIDDYNIVTLAGEVDCWKDVVDIGHAVAKVQGVENVVNNITAKGIEATKKDYRPIIDKGREIGDIRDVDVVIVGAGISGCGIARELSKYNLNIVVVEKGDDVATAASKANNGNIHPGSAVKPGTLKAKLNVRGNELYSKWAEELGFKLERCGSMGIVCDEGYVKYLEKAKVVCDINGVPNVRIISPEEIKKMEPSVKDLEEEVAGGLWIPTMGLVEPFKVCIALAENAIDNGVEFILDCTVGEVITEDGIVKGVVTDKGIIKAPYAINCAGVYADDLAEMAGDKFFTIHPRKGTIAILDKDQEPMFNALTGIYTAKSLSVKKNQESKGGGMCKTPEGNILLGPSATEVPNKEDVASDPADLAYAMSRSQNPKIGYKDIISFFTGVRPADYKEDFIIGMSKKIAGFINVAAIQSPGLAAAPAVAEMVEGILKDDFIAKEKKMTLKEDFNPIRERERVFRGLSREEQDDLIKENPKYGNIICRCESISEGEIIDAIQSPLPPTSVDAIKRRTRAGMGRCQGGFCQPRVLEILAREHKKEWTDITLKGKGSNILLKSNR